MHGYGHTLLLEDTNARLDMDSKYSENQETSPLSLCFFNRQVNEY